MNKHQLLITSLAAVAAFAGACNGSDAPRVEQPFGKSSDPLPRGAELIPIEDYESARDAGNLMPAAWVPRSRDASKRLGVEGDVDLPEALDDLALDSLPSAAAAAPQPLRACEGDEGFAAGEDAALESVASSCLVPSPDGILANFDYPLKPYVTCVKNQGQRRTCWAFTAASMIETAIAVKHGRYLNLSEQDITNRSKLFWWPENFEERNGEDFLKKMAREGYRPPLESAWVYNPSLYRRESESKRYFYSSCQYYEGVCSDSAHQGRFVCADLGDDRYCGYLGLDNPRDTFAPISSRGIWKRDHRDRSLKRAIQALTELKSVSIAFDVTTNYQQGKTFLKGWVPFGRGIPDQDTGKDHIVHIVGFVSNAELALKLPGAAPADGGGYFVAKESAGACVGDAGYVYVPYGFFKKRTRAIWVLNEIE